MDRCSPPMAAACGDGRRGSIYRWRCNIWEMNVKWYSAILASVSYYLSAIHADMSPEALMDQISDRSWLHCGFLSSNMNRPKMVYDLCLKYGIENRGYDDIFSRMRELYRPEKEVAVFETLLRQREKLAGRRKA